MPLYRWNADNLEAVQSTTFEAEQLQERGDLQRLLRDQPDVLEDGLFIVAEEFSNWQDSGRSIDLLALDTDGNLVVIELKRTQSGDHSELQGIRYAAMVANMTLEQVIDSHRRYLAKRGVDEDARVQVLSHLEVSDEADAEIHTERPRILLASAGFSTELTTSVLWLRDGGMDISCIKFQLYQSGDGLLLDTSQVIPLPEATDYLVKVRENSEVDRGRRKRGRHSVQRIPGAEAFLSVIEEVPEYDKPMLNRLYDWAVSLEQEGLSILGTRLGSHNKSLRCRLPNVVRPPAIIYRAGDKNRFDLVRARIHQRAPEADARIEEILGPSEYSLGKTSHVRELPDGLLDALTDAYREANGLPPTTPPLGTAPGSPALAE